MKVLLVDDHDQSRRGTEDCLRVIDAAVEVFHARTCEEGIALARAHPLDLVLLDLGFPYDKGEGLRALVAMKGAFESLRVVVHSGQVASRELVLDCLDKLAMGFIPKGSDESFIEALRVVLSGRIYVPVFALEPNRPGNPSEKLLSDLSNTNLTPALREITRWLVTGKSHKEIARQLGKSEQTIRNATRPIFAEFKVKRRAELILELVRRGWL
jgi:DNA-binding NarL/FixJ family response regulator